MDSESERISLPVPQEEAADDLMYSNTLYQGDLSYPPATEGIMNHDGSSSSGMMIKKGKPSTYYLRFG